jgi:hypothetical protein
MHTKQITMQPNAHPSLKPKPELCRKAFFIRVHYLPLVDELRCAPVRAIRGSPFFRPLAASISHLWLCGRQRPSKSTVPV